MKHFIIGIVAMLTPLAIWSQEDSSVHRLKQVVVTATQHAVERDESPTVVNVIGSETLESASANNLAEGLQLSTGLRVENTCQNCGANEVRINGLGGEYSQLLIDSRPLIGPLAGIYMLELLPAAMIDRVEVMRGGGSALYGSNAIAGVINIITKEPRYNSATASNTTRLLGKGSVDWGNQFGASVVSESHRAGLFVYGANRQRTPYDRNGDGYSELGLQKSNMLGFRSYLRTGSWGKLNLEYHHLHEYRRGGDRFDLPSPMAHISEGGEHDIHCGNLKWDLFSSDGLGHLALFASAQHVDRQSYYGERDDTEPFGNAYGYTSDLTTSEGLLYSRSFQHLWFMPAELTAGLEHNYDHLSDHNLYNSDTLRQSVHILSAFLQNEWRTYRWSILIGARADKHTMIGRPTVSPRLSLRYAPADHTVFRAGYSSGFRAPQVYDEDLHVGAVNGELYRITNAEGLRMERSHSFNLSADICLHLGAIDIDMLLEAFHTSINDAFAIVWLYDDVASGFRHYERQNADGATVQGLNLELNSTPIPSMQLQAGATLQRSTYTGQGIEYAEGKHEKRMERSPAFYGFLAINYSPLPKLDLLLRGTVTGPMLVYHAVDDDVLQVTTPTFFDLTLRGSYTIPLGDRTTFNLNCGIQNILDAYQRDLDSGPERDSKYIYGPSLPRTLFVGVKLSL